MRKLWRRGISWTGNLVGAGVRYVLSWRLQERFPLSRKIPWLGWLLVGLFVFVWFSWPITWKLGITLSRTASLTINLGPWLNSALLYSACSVLKISKLPWFYSGTRGVIRFIPSLVLRRRVLIFLHAVWKEVWCGHMYLSSGNRRPLILSTAGLSFPSGGIEPCHACNIWVLLT